MHLKFLVRVDSLRHGCTAMTNIGKSAEHATKCPINGQISGCTVFVVDLNSHVMKEPGGPAFHSEL